MKTFKCTKDVDIKLSSKGNIKLPSSLTTYLSQELLQDLYDWCSPLHNSTYTDRQYPFPRS